MSTTYQSAGVNIDAGNEAVSRIKHIVKTTFDEHVLTGIGSFGSMYDIGSFLKNYHHPILVQSTDSVGTKVKIATMTGKHKNIGLDMVGHSCGDILAQGARPITFLDYIATDSVRPDHIAEVVRGLAEGCQESGMSLVGGEVAEMPGVYAPNEYDLVGTITGIVEKDKVITGERIAEGDILLGFASNGLHTNGYSLARKLFFEMGHYSVTSEIPEFEGTVGEELLKPHTNYTRPVLGLLDAGIDIKGIAHITGGGMLENIPRILPKSCVAEIQKGSWPVLPIFNVVQQIGGVEEREMYRTFNMGIGMVLVVHANDVGKVKMKVSEFSEFDIYEIGRVVERTGQVIFM